MKIILITLAFIGLLKLVSLFITGILQIYHYYKGNNIIEFHRDSCFYIKNISDIYIIPTISISLNYGYLSICFYWLTFEYYECTKFELEHDKK